MPARDLDHLEPVLKPEMVRFPSPNREASARHGFTVLDVLLAITQVRELRRVTPDSLELACRSRCVQGKLGLDLELCDELRVLHLQQFPIPADLELAVEPKSLDLHRDVAEFGPQGRMLFPMEAGAHRGEVFLGPMSAHR